MLNSREKMISKFKYKMYVSNNGKQEKNGNRKESL